MQNIELKFKKLNNSFSRAPSYPRAFPFVLETISFVPEIRRPEPFLLKYENTANWHGECTP